MQAGADMGGGGGGGGGEGVAFPRSIQSKSMQPSDVAYRVMSASRIGLWCDNRVPQMRTDS